MARPFLRKGRDDQIAQLGENAVIAFVVMMGLMWLARPLRPSTVHRGSRKLQLVSASMMAFSHGSNDAQKSMGIGQPLRGAGQHDALHQRLDHRRRRLQADLRGALGRRWQHRGRLGADAARGRPAGSARIRGRFAVLRVIALRTPRFGV